MKNYVTVQEMRQKKKQQQIDIKNKIDMEVGKAARGLLEIKFSNGSCHKMFTQDCRAAAQLILKESLRTYGLTVSQTWLAAIRQLYKREIDLNEIQFTVLFSESEYEKI